MKQYKKNRRVDASIRITIVDESVEINAPVIEHMTGPEAVLPFARQLTDVAVANAIRRVEDDGKNISCAKGCGACCAQLVPISEIEARGIAAMLRAWPKGRRQKIMSRFTHAKLRFEEAGLWQTLLEPEQLEQGQVQSLALDYFAERVACPFLEDGACSIHPERPLACREYLVTSDPRHCAEPAQGNINGVEIPLRASRMLGRLYEDEAEHVSELVPLIVAPYWPRMHPEKPAKRTGPEWVRAFVGKVKS